PNRFEAFELSTTRSSRIRHSAAAPACEVALVRTRISTRSLNPGCVKGGKGCATQRVQSRYRKRSCAPSRGIAIAQQIEGSSPGDLYEEVCRPDAAQQPPDPKDCRDMYSRQRSWIESETR